MLLRLLPNPSPIQPSPPTILFTLPMPSHPYTSKSLPLPPNLLAHRSVCLQEDIDCPNVLMGEKSSWISGVVDDVTFSLPSEQTIVQFIDGTSVTFSLEAECVQSLHQVIRQVQLSFAPPPSVESVPRISTSSSMSVSSSVSSCSSSSSRRSPSALLLSLLSPLMSQSNPPAAQLPTPPPQPPARLYRRAARSLLVDTYRRHVLPALREHLPSAYLQWVIAGETAKKTAECDQLREAISRTLALAGVTQRPESSRRSSCSSDSESNTDSDSDSDSMPSPITPATSIFSRSQCSSPIKRTKGLPTVQTFVSSMPAAHTIPSALRSTYTTQLQQLTALSTRLQSIKKLESRYEREEGKRRWLESLERGRASDKALRRAFVNGQLPHGSAAPIKRSGLWQSWMPSTEITHPAMVEEENTTLGSSAIESDSESESEDESHMPPTPTSMTHRSSLRLRVSASIDPEDEIVIQDKIILVRPPMTHHDEHIGSANDEEKTPSLTSSTSDESLSSDEDWDVGHTTLSALLPSKPILAPWNGNLSTKKMAPPLPPRPNTKKLVEWSDRVQIAVIGADPFEENMELGMDHAVYA